MASIKFTGLDKLQKRFKQMERGAEELGRTKHVSFDKLFNSRFMKKNTQFSNFAEFLRAGNFEVNSQEDYEPIPDDAFDAHVKANTKFSTWEEMLGEAKKEYIAKKLGF